MKIKIAQAMLAMFMKGSRAVVADTAASKN